MPVLTPPLLSRLLYPVIIVPQVYLYEPEELTLQMGESQKKREILIPLLIGLGFAVSLGATGTAGAALIQTQHLASDFQDKLDQAMASTTVSLESLQCQITSLAGVALSNRRALDLLTAEQGGTCVFLGEKCCFYVNESAGRTRCTNAQRTQGEPLDTLYSQHPYPLVL